MTSAFLLRNLADLEPGPARDAARDPAGRPRGRARDHPGDAPGFTPLFRFYFHHVVPRIGQLVGGDREAYTYLPQSVDRFVTPQELVALMEKVGLRGVTYRRASAWAPCTVHTGRSREARAPRGWPPPTRPADARYRRLRRTPRPAASARCRFTGSERCRASSSGLRRPHRRDLLFDPGRRRRPPACRPSSCACRAARSAVDWCDTKYSWDPAAGRAVDLDGLLAEVAAYPCRRVVITGGEPLESSLFCPLVSALQRAVRDRGRDLRHAEPPAAVSAGRSSGTSRSSWRARASPRAGASTRRPSGRFLGAQRLVEVRGGEPGGSRRGAPPGRALRAAARAHPAPARGPPARRS